MPEIEHTGVMHKFGKNTDVDSAAAETVWDGGGIYSYLAAAEIHSLASVGDDAGDDVATGTGARTVTIIGLDANWDEQRETVTMTGATPVLTTSKFIRIFRMYVATAGSGGANAGLISATAAVTESVTAAISIGFNQTLMAVYSIPRNFSGHLASYYASVNKKTSASADIILRIRKFGGVLQTKHAIGVATTGTGYFDHIFQEPMYIPEKSDIEIQADVSTDNVDVSGGFCVFLNDLPG